MEKYSAEQIRNQVLCHFAVEGELLEAPSYGSGHINDTYAPRLRLSDGREIRYILQRINTGIFQDPKGLMENIAGVTSYLKGILAANGGDPLRETLTLIPTKDDQPFYQAPDGSCWRMYLFVEDTISYDLVEKPEDFYISAKAFGRFQMLLAGYPAATLHETILNFHNTVSRFENLKKAIAADPLGRAKEVQPEIEFALARETDTHVLVDLQAKGEIPLRVTHNDTKLNNVLIDPSNGRVCVIDLDTVMPGLAHYDFGDSIRFGASTALEDEQDLSKVSMDLNLFDIYTKGFLEEAGAVLSPLEKELLPMGAKLMPYECGIRFLTDYLEGDTYFRTHRPGQNLDRTRTQFKLVADMEAKWDAMAAIIKKYA